MFPTPKGGLDDAWSTPSPAGRLHALIRAAEMTRAALLDEGPAIACATVRLASFPYPSTYAFMGAALSPVPFVMMTNQMHVVQFLDDDGQRRTLIFNPTDYDRSKRAPYFAKLIEQFGSFLSEKVIPTLYGPVETRLGALGLTPADVDYLAFDHLHVQDVRRWLGDGTSPAVFPHARLLVMPAEWEAARHLHPLNRPWYVPDGVAGVPEGRVHLLPGSVKLGTGVALLKTPGHTQGNMTLAVATPHGLFTSSENGIAPECYAPAKSRIPGVRSFAERMGYEVILNGNTRENSLDQYASMLVEKIVAGPSPDEPDFPAVCPSSPLTSSPFAPGFAPTYEFVPKDFGAFAARSVARAQ